MNVLLQVSSDEEELDEEEELKEMLVVVREMLVMRETLLREMVTVMLMTKVTWEMCSMMMVSPNQLPKQRHYISLYLNFERERERNKMFQIVCMYA